VDYLAEMCKIKTTNKLKFRPYLIQVVHELKESEKRKAILILPLD
jgi:hypothetical protein